MVVVVHESGVLDTLSKHFPKGSAVSVGPGWPESRVRWMIREGWLRDEAPAAATVTMNQSHTVTVQVERKSRRGRR